MKLVLVVCTSATVTALLSAVALALWQCVDAVYVVCLGMGALTILVIEDCEINGLPIVGQ